MYAHNKLEHKLKNIKNASRRLTQKLLTFQMCRKHENREKSRRKKG